MALFLVDYLHLVFYNCFYILICLAVSLMGPSYLAVMVVDCWSEFLLLKLNLGVMLALSLLNFLLYLMLCQC
jgi:hypothetical protein